MRSSKIVNSVYLRIKAFFQRKFQSSRRIHLEITIKILYNDKDLSMHLLQKGRQMAKTNLNSLGDTLMYLHNQAVQCEAFGRTFSALYLVYYLTQGPQRQNMQTFLQSVPNESFEDRHSLLYVEMIAPVILSHPVVCVSRGGRLEARGNAHLQHVIPLIGRGFESR